MFFSFQSHLSVSQVAHHAVEVAGKGMKMMMMNRLFALEPLQITLKVVCGSALHLL